MIKNPTSIKFIKIGLVLISLFIANAWIGCIIPSQFFGAIVIQGFVLLTGAFICGGIAFENYDK